MQQQFVGLTMPVFTAFGWAGEEQAMTFARSQLEQFITSLHAALPRRVQTLLPFFGMDTDSDLVYLSANQEPEEGLYIAFITRPMSLELQVSVTEQMAISKALKPAAADPEQWMHSLQELSGTWTLHVKQMELDQDSGERSSYQDLFKGEVSELDQEEAESVTSRAHFLNGEPQWVTPIHISRRFTSEKIAAMGTDVVDYMAEQVRDLFPLLETMIGKVSKPAPKKTESKARAKAKAPEPTRPAEEIDPEDQFVYVAKLQPLHLRRGFVNLTPEHWDFFAQSARDTTRDITVAYEDHVDKESSVWRLSSNDLARIVLSERARDWLEATFVPEDQVQITATKLDDDEIEVILQPAD